jgi:hypothetical protein
MKDKYEKELWDLGWDTAQAVKGGDTSRLKFESDYARKCQVHCDKSTVCFDQGYRAFRTLTKCSNPYT